MAKLTMPEPKCSPLMKILIAFLKAQKLLHPDMIWQESKADPHTGRPEIAVEPRGQSRLCNIVLYEPGQRHAVIVEPRPINRRVQKSIPIYEDLLKQFCQGRDCSVRT